MSRTFIHPGWITSRNDGDRHFIDFPHLCELYRVDPGDPNTINAQYGLKAGFKEEPGDRHFYPRYDGKYPIFEEDSGGSTRNDSEVQATQEG